MASAAPLTKESPLYPPVKFAYLRWDTKANGTRPFCNSLIFFDMDALTPTRGTIASIFGVERFEALHLLGQTGKVVDFTTTSATSLDPIFELERGCEYAVRLDTWFAAEVQALTRVETLTQALGERTVRALSKSFYGRVYARPLEGATRMPEVEHFRSLFAVHASEDEAVTNQSDFFVELWSGGVEIPYSKRKAPHDTTGRAATLEVISKHPASIMKTKYAVLWLHYMGEAIEECVSSFALRKTLKAYMLHFLGFFELDRLACHAAIHEGARGGELQDASAPPSAGASEAKQSMRQARL